MTQIEDFIYQHEGDQREVMLALHELLALELGLTAKLRYKIPFYYRKSWICYINPVKRTRVELAFIRGNELSNEQGLLISKGRKQVLGIEFEKASDIPFEALHEIIRESLMLDEMVHYKSKRSKK